MEAEPAPLRHVDDCGGCDHLGGGAQPEQHLWAHGFPGLDIGHAEPARVDHTVPHDDRDGGAWRLGLLQLFADDGINTGEIGSLGLLRGHRYSRQAQGGQQDQGRSVSAHAHILRRGR